MEPEIPDARNTNRCVSELKLSPHLSHSINDRGGTEPKQHHGPCGQHTPPLAHYVTDAENKMAALTVVFSTSKIDC